jgi:hypothetical protein
MRKSLHRTHSFGWLLIVLALAGCGGDNKVGPPPAIVPQTDTPIHLVQRLERTWESQDLPEYGKLLTQDFHFGFSADADPDLVYQYPNWGLDDETESTRHMFEGFINLSGTPIPAASRIELTLVGVAVEDDWAHADSTAHYRKVVVTTMDGTIEFPDEPDTLTYSLSSRQEFFVVRGDAAVLAAGVAPDPTRWYVRRWDDLSVNPFNGRRNTIDALGPKTYGAIKALFR